MKLILCPRLSVFLICSISDKNPSRRRKALFRDKILSTFRILRIHSKDYQYAAEEPPFYSWTDSAIACSPERDGGFHRPSSHRGFQGAVYPRPDRYEGFHWYRQ